MATLQRYDLVLTTQRKRCQGMYYRTKARAAILFTDRPEKHKLGRGH